MDSNFYSVPRLVLCGDTESRALQASADCPQLSPRSSSTRFALRQLRTGPVPTALQRLVVLLAIRPLLARLLCRPTRLLRLLRRPRALRSALKTVGPAFRRLLGLCYGRSYSLAHLRSASRHPAATLCPSVPGASSLSQTYNAPDPVQPDGTLGSRLLCVFL